MSMIIYANVTRFLQVVLICHDEIDGNWQITSAMSVYIIYVITMMMMMTTTILPCFSRKLCQTVWSVATGGLQLL